MLKRKIVFFVFLLLTVVNLVIFFFRDHFQFRQYADYRSLYEICDISCSEKWSRFISDFPQQEFNQSKQITDSIIRDSVSGYEKVFRIGSFLYREFHDQLGKPTEQLLRSSPLQQYRQLKASDSIQLWCGNFASLFSYFCWSKDIAARTIDLMKSSDRHIVNESYIPELGRWILNDVTNNIIAVRNNTGAFLDLAALRDSLKKNATLIVYSVSGDSLKRSEMESRNFPSAYKGDYPVLYYHRINYEEVNSFGNRMRRYFFAEPWYDIFAVEQGSNTLFRVKQVFIVLWILSFFVFLISRTKFRI